MVKDAILFLAVAGQFFAAWLVLAALYGGSTMLALVALGVFVVGQLVARSV